MKMMSRLAAGAISAAAMLGSALAAPTVTIATGEDADDVVLTLDAYGRTPGLIAVPDPGEQPDAPGQTSGTNPLSSTGVFIDFAGGNIRPVQDGIATTDATFSDDAGDGSVRSSFVIGDLRFELTQTLTPVAASGDLPGGAVLNQTYVLTNTGTSPVEFGMTRVVNPRGSNTGGIERVDGAIRPYAFGQDGQRYYLTAEGGADGGFGTLSELGDADLFAGPRTGDAFAEAFGGGVAGGDTNGDGVSDSNRFDALAIRRVFALAGGESATYSTSTFLGIAPRDGGGDPEGPGGPGQPGRPQSPGDGTPGSPYMPTGGGGGPGTPSDPDDDDGPIITYFPDMPFEINGRCIANCQALGVQYTLFQFIPAEFVLSTTDLDTGETYYFDPPIAVGYTYEVTGAEFASVTAPTLDLVADPDGYTLAYADADGNVVRIALAAGETHVFGAPVSEFFLYGISEELEIGTPSAGDFVLGIAFASFTGEELVLTQTGYGIDPDEFDGDVVPLPAGAVLLLTGLAGGGLMRRRVRAA